MIRPKTRAEARIAAHSSVTVWDVLPGLPMFFLIPLMIRSEMGFWVALGVGCSLTVILYLVMIGVASRFGLHL